MGEQNNVFHNLLLIENNGSEWENVALFIGAAYRREIYTLLFKSVWVELAGLSSPNSNV